VDGGALEVQKEAGKLSPSARLRRVSPRGLGDSSRGKKIALRSTAGPIRDSELYEEICVVRACRPGTMSFTEYFVWLLFHVCISEGARDQLVLKGERAFWRG
jgi:hypothetical protein